MQSLNLVWINHQNCTWPIFHLKRALRGWSSVHYILHLITRRVSELMGC